MQTILNSFKSGNHLIELNVYQYLLREKVEKILVACSGGADSVFALFLLLTYQKEIGFDLEVAHFNHKWRGFDSGKDAQYVKDLAETFRLPYHYASAELDKSAKTETSAREARIEFLRKTANEIGARVIAFGHQMDDILETQIQRIARGSGLEGLIAPRPVYNFEKYPSHIRPILNYSAAKIKLILTQLSIQWCNDVSNADQSIPRNKLRKSLIPSLELVMGRDVNEGAKRSRMLLEEDFICLDALAREALPQCYGLSYKLDRSKFHQLNKALVRRGILFWLHRMNSGFVASATFQEQLLNAVLSDQHGRKFSAGPKFIRMNKRHIWLENG